MLCCLWYNPLSTPSNVSFPVWPYHGLHSWESFSLNTAHFGGWLVSASSPWTNWTCIFFFDRTKGLCHEYGTITMVPLSFPTNNSCHWVLLSCSKVERKQKEWQLLASRTLIWCKGVLFSGTAGALNLSVSSLFNEFSQIAWKSWLSCFLVPTASDLGSPF